MSAPAPATNAASAARPGTRTATPETLGSLIQAAQPGDHILLEPGNYGSLMLRRRVFAGPGIVIEAKPGARPVFSEIALAECEGLEIKGVEVAITSANFGVAVGGGSRITFTDLKVHADGALNAMMLRNAYDLTVQDSDFRMLGTGVNILDSHHVKVLNNTFSEIQVDAIRGAASYAEVVGNKGTNFRPQPGDHPDFIQFWATAQSGASKMNVIRDNVYARGDGAPAQGIFLENSEGVTIQGNALLGTLYNAISLSTTKGGLIEGNFIQGYSDIDARIIVRGGSSDITVRENVAQAVVNYRDGGQDNPRYKEDHNQSVRGARVGDTSAMTAWLAKRQPR